MAISGQEHYGELDTDSYESDDSQSDPNFDILEETRSSFSNLRIKDKSKCRSAKEMNENSEEDLDFIEVILPEFDEKDQKSYETVQKFIEGGMIEKLKVDQCKVYLRKHGLRLTGNKDILIQRIKEHLDVVNGGGEKKYPASSFVLNCKGDACTGDVVMFEQNVYEMFSIASRSANGPPCGTRVVAGRIVKESYGAAKQQHTFTIEVLWSKGEKPLPPLHPLLIKGRNLYRLKTMRQRWKDEGERQKILLEKHTRGCIARSDRDARVQEKEMRKMHKSNRIARMENQNKRNKHGKSSDSTPMNPEKLGNQPQKHQQEKKNAAQQEQYSQQEYCRPKTCGVSIPQLQESLPGKPNNPSNAYVPPERLHQRQPFTAMNYSFPRSPIQLHPQNYIGNSNYPHIPILNHTFEENRNYNYIRSSLLGAGPMSNSVQVHAYLTQENFNATRNPVQRQGPERKQACRFFAQGICHYGDRCKYLHDYVGK
ncbi:zinc finger CCCH domain-containing protein 62-like [Forsythia ovata]|uniref:Zinc finger CCCH domain-containing protein 62-like n=1 Tax=Forsythia ovata TaxID=205694 RepID=A0ABD1P104_9LAMI